MLYPSVLRDVLVRAAVAGLVQARWTNRILDETFTSLRRNRPDLSAVALTRTRELMNAAVRDAVITDYEDLEPLVLGLPDPDDRHVVAAAAKARAHVIVTHNLRDFPQEALDPWQLSAVDPDRLAPRHPSRQPGSSPVDHRRNRHRGPTPGPSASTMSSTGSAPATYRKQSRRSAAVLGLWHRGPRTNLAWLTGVGRRRVLPSGLHLCRRQAPAAAGRLLTFCGLSAD